MNPDIATVMHMVLGLFSVANLVVVIRAAWTLSERLTKVDARLELLSVLPEKVGALDKRVTKVEYDLNALFMKLRESNVITSHEGMRRIHEEHE
jgi:uncharacterized membrane protein